MWTETSEFSKKSPGVNKKKRCLPTSFTTTLLFNRWRNLGRWLWHRNEGSMKILCRTKNEKAQLWKAFQLFSSVAVNSSLFYLFVVHSIEVDVSLGHYCTNFESSLKCWGDFVGQMNEKLRSSLQFCCSRMRKSEKSFGKMFLLGEVHYCINFGFCDVFGGFCSTN